VAGFEWCSCCRLKPVGFSFFNYAITLFIHPLSYTIEQTAVYYLKDTRMLISCFIILLVSSSAASNL